MANYLHRNSQKRIYADYVYFTTCKTYKNYPYFIDKILCQLWIEELKLCKQIYEFDLYAFCLMYDHFHLLLKPNNLVGDLSLVIQFLKRNFSRNVNFVMGFNDFDMKHHDWKHNKGTKYDNDSVGDDSEDDNPEGDNDHCRLPVIQSQQIHNDYRKNKLIKNFDVKILKFKNIFKQNKQIIPKFQWQKSYHDHYIRNTKDFNNHYYYIVTNHFKHKLQDDWKFNSNNFRDIMDYFE